MQVALVSDTHVPERADAITDPFRERIAAADHTIHAGDFEAPEVLADVRELAADLTAVNGNVDPVGIGLPDVDAVTVGGVTFVVTHGTLNPVERAVFPTDGMVMTREDWLNAVADTARARVRGWANDDPVVGVGGHSHQVVDDVHEGIRVLNPGSATGADPADVATMMTVEVENGTFEVTLHELAE
ncbi:metallophosphoesterase family protein [Halomarina litorea]|uniref:metallophosphoesterase family protein n=1 Tax=Halomarina litorea TaxID=2961595 RepID=UPI0020C49B3C|nr:metallophosphoesterase family protein [Halomarina sp. BCD28]